MTAAARRCVVILLVGGLCHIGWAGEVGVKVTDGGAPVAGAVVNIEPAGPSGRTNGDGLWEAAGVAAGDYRVIAWKTIAGDLRGAISDVTVPAAGGVKVKLKLVEAVWTYDHFPFGVGNAWQYQYRHRGTDGTWRATWRDRVDRSLMYDGEPAVVLAASKDGVPEWEEIRASTREGFVIYTQQHGADTIKFDPPMRIGALLPVGYEWAVNATAHHSDGSPDEPASLRCKLTGFETVTVPAGRFTDAARLEVRMTLGAEANDLKVWTAHLVGIVRQIESNPERTNTKLLEEYRVRGVPMRPVGPLRPVRPLPPRP
ncbi:MAG: carboxypeptidase-like regulatory domain-containing protein [Armatimonadota bacterium]